jgi:hypothetical protein
MHKTESCGGAISTLTLYSRGPGYTLIILIKNIYIKLSVEAHRVVRRRGTHIFYTIGSQMALRL